MEIPNYDSYEKSNNGFKQLYRFMPKNTFRMLLAGNSGSGKTNLLSHILQSPLIYNSPNKIIHSKNNHTLILFGTMRGLMREMSIRKNSK